MAKKKEYVRFLTPRAVKLLRRVQAHIRKEPLRFHMEFWQENYRPDGEPNPRCNTVGCLGGWAELLGNRCSLRAWWRRNGKDAYALLGAEEGTDAYSAVDDLLMNYDGSEGPRIAWANFGDATAGTPAQQVERACKVIDRFIERHSLPAKGA
jgi:hypothetical protein